MTNTVPIYEAAKSVPSWGQSPITKGPLAGLTNIKLEWRLDMLRKIFGDYGFGWKIECTDKRIVEGRTLNEKVVFMDINLYVKVGDKWSEPMFGTGGAVFTWKEGDVKYFLDEAFKIAQGDALAQATRYLGFASDVYRKAEKTKYGIAFGDMPLEALQPTVQDNPYVIVASDPTPTQTNVNTPTVSVKEKVSLPQDKANYTSGQKASITALSNRNEVKSTNMTPIAPSLTKKKPVLSPTDKKQWNAMITRIAVSTQAIGIIVKSLKEAYEISDKDLSDILDAAGKQAANL